MAGSMIEITGDILLRPFSNVSRPVWGTEFRVSPWLATRH